ncbi:hypothetical protein RF11_09032 [Thelohanellus kitauei]|uniref:Uncharacterized protein n=1 Tax=Thelohanellus kitauei TaxID=669202 RepID=A0A0C2JMV8_THEKT|nr:hypothetical protein RF11_09032 [Thelohanellus kitauei]
MATLRFTNLVKRNKLNLNTYVSLIGHTVSTQFYQIVPIIGHVPLRISKLYINIRTNTVIRQFRQAICFYICAASDNVVLVRDQHKSCLNATIIKNIERKYGI